MVRLVLALLRVLAAVAATAVSAELADDFNIPKGWRMQVCIYECVFVVRRILYCGHY